MVQLSLLEASRQEDPGLDDRSHVARVAHRLIKELEERPPVSLDVVAGYQGISDISYGPLPNGGCLITDGQSGRSRICLRASDHPRRQRFSGFHEVAHTFMPGYQLQIRWRCDPPRTNQASNDLEALCDHGAAELLLPKRFVQQTLAAADFGLSTVVDMADTYEASLEAAAHRFVALWPEDTLLIVAEVSNKPAEVSDPGAPPKLRVRYAWRRGAWPYIRRHKSFAEDDALQRTLEGEAVDERGSLRVVSAQIVEDLDVSARLCPYHDSEGRRHDRVLALYRRPSS